MLYYLSKNDGLYTGPFTTDQLIANGLERDTMVWREGLAAWIPAYQLPELNDIIAETPPPLEMTLGPVNALREPVQQSVQHLQQSVDTNAKIKQQLEQLNKEKAELKQVLEQKKNEGNKKLVEARDQRRAEIKEKKKTEEKEAKKELAKAKKKTKDDYPVCDWRNESIWLLAFVAIHAAIGYFNDSASIYLYLDILGAVLSIIGIVIGVKIKQLNKISYKKGSPERNLAEKLGYFNGIFVSATAAVGFLIILYQSAYYVYVS